MIEKGKYLYKDIQRQTKIDSRVLLRLGILLEGHIVAVYYIPCLGRDHQGTNGVVVT